LTPAHFFAARPGFGSPVRLLSNSGDGPAIGLPVEAIALVAGVDAFMDTGLGTASRPSGTQPEKWKQRARYRADLARTRLIANHAYRVRVADFTKRAEA
jgi:hypothetical protein